MIAYEYSITAIERVTEGDEMTKSEKRELNHIACLHAAGLADAAYVARALSALYRASRGFDRDDIKAVAERLGVRFHLEFITG